MASVTFLGTGPGDVMPGRFQSSLLLQMENTALLLDAGEPCTAQLLELGISLTTIDAVCLTHAHVDHTGGLPLFLQASWLHGRTAALPLGVPGHLEEPLRAWLRAVLLGRLPFSLEAFGWRPDEAVELGGVTITPRVTTHLARLSRELNDPGIVSYLFDIRGGGRRAVYTGDLGAASDLTASLAEPVDVLVCELAHLTVDDLVATLAGARVRVLCLTHVARSIGEDEREALRVRCERDLPGVEDVYLPEDGERIDF